MRILWKRATCIALCQALAYLLALALDAGPTAAALGSLPGALLGTAIAAALEEKRSYHGPKRTLVLPMLCLSALALVLSSASVSFDAHTPSLLVYMFGGISVVTVLCIVFDAHFSNTEQLAAFVITLPWGRAIGMLGVLEFTLGDGSLYAFAKPLVSEYSYELQTGLVFMAPVFISGLVKFLVSRISYSSPMPSTVRGGP